MLTRSEHGFTLVELIVSMVVLSIVMVAAVTVITSGFRGSSKSLNERQAIQQVTRTQSSLDLALRSAKAPDRDETIISDSRALSGALLTGAPMEGRRTAGGTQVTLDVSDIVYADGTRLVVRSDVLPRAGTECVEYRVTTAGTDRSLARHVWFGAAPGAAPAPCPGAAAPDASETLISLLGDNA